MAKLHNIKPEDYQGWIKPKTHQSQTAIASGAEIAAHIKRCMAKAFCWRGWIIYCQTLNNYINEQQLEGQGPAITKTRWNKE